MPNAIIALIGPDVKETDILGLVVFSLIFGIVVVSVKFFILHDKGQYCIRRNILVQCAYFVIVLCLIFIFFSGSPKKQTAHAAR